jgi:Ca2+-binding EF-hand superfamily protein
MGKRAKRMLKRLDSDGNGTIELAEMEQMKPGKRMFDRLDENEDGVISQEEFDAMKGKRDRKAKRQSSDE